MILTCRHSNHRLKFIIDFIRVHFHGVMHIYHAIHLSTNYTLQYLDHIYVVALSSFSSLDMGVNKETKKKDRHIIQSSML